MKQRSMTEYIKPPADFMKDYKIQSSGWEGKSGISSPISTKTKTRSTRLKSRSKKKTSQSPHQSTKELASPLDKWIQRRSNSWDRFKELNEHNRQRNEDKSKLVKNPISLKSESFEKYGVVFPTVDDILDNMNKLNQERRILEDYEDLVCECDVTIPSSLKNLLDSPEKGPKLPQLTCEHLSKSELKKYLSKYWDYLRNISNGIEFSQRHQTYNDHKSRSKLTYSFSTIVFAESQLEYLMKKIEKKLDPEGKRTEYLFMVSLPELCLKIFTDEFEMSKAEAVDYLNRRSFD